MTLIDTLSDVPEGWRVSIHLDEHPESPRNMTDNAIHVLTVPSREYVDVDQDPGPWGHSWRHLLDRYRASEAIEIVERWARTNGHFTYDHDSYRGARSVWYLTREDAAREGWTEPVAALKAYAEEYDAWANGHVYGFVIERRVTWCREDDPTVTRDDWEHVDSCWGFYGPDIDDVEYAAREALAAHVSDPTVPAPTAP